LYEYYYIYSKNLGEFVAFIMPFRKPKT